MDNTLIMWISIIAISATGTLAHFLYDLTGEHRAVGLFTAVNESTWEHIKIAITPSLLWGLYDGYYYGENPNYFCAKLASLLVLTVFIPAVFVYYFPDSLLLFRKPLKVFPIADHCGKFLHDRKCIVILKSNED